MTDSNSLLGEKTIGDRACRMRWYLEARCRRNNLDFDLDKQWIIDRLIRGVCEVTGIPFEYESKGRSHRSKYAASVDRINPNNGYTKDNCRMVVYQYNAAKGSWSDESVEVLAEAMLRNKRKQNE